MTVISVGSGQTSSGLPLAAGDTLEVFGGGTTSAISVGSGDIEYVSSGISFDTVISNGGTEIAAPHGTADATIVLAGGTFNFGGAVSGAIVRGGVDNDSGEARSDTVSAGGSETVADDGTASFTTVSNGGVQIVNFLGTATDTIVKSGGVQSVNASGVIDATISTGGSQTVTYHGVTTNSLLQSGGFEFVSFGGFASGTRIDGGTEVISTYANIVGATIDGGSLEIISGGSVDTGGIVFAGPGTVAISSGTPAFVVSDFHAGDSVDFSNASSSIVTSGGETMVDGLAFASLFPSSGAGSLNITGDGQSGTLLTVLPCFTAGTRVLTACGESAVQALCVGDRIATASGRIAPIVWIGHRRTERARPVRISARAFASGAPWRDLWLSPDHAVFVDGALVPVRLLINGMTIVEEVPADIDYWHVELAAHDVIVAEGLAAESFLDTGNRAALEPATAWPVRLPSPPATPLPSRPASNPPAPSRARPGAPPRRQTAG